MACKALILRPPEQSFDRTFILAARFEEQDRHRDDPGDISDAKIWVAKAGASVKKETGLPWSPWIDIQYYQRDFKQRHYLAVLDQIQEYDTMTSNTGFERGRPMTDEAISIPLCCGKERPQKLYRVVHAAHPSRGICARGYGKVKANPLTFQIHLQKHLHWGYRGEGPFMSASSSLERARFVGAIYKERKHTGIEILTIDTTGPEWEHTKLYHVRALLKRFKLPILNCKKYFDEEYIIQDKIPETRLTRMPLNDAALRCSWRRYEKGAKKQEKNNQNRKRKGGPEPKSLPYTATATKPQPVSGEGLVELPAIEEDQDEPPKKKRCPTTRFSRVSRLK